LPDGPTDEPLDHEEEYIDEDKYTSVTVESVSVSRDGLHKPEEEPDTEEEEKERREATARSAKEQAARPKKPKKQKFRYESKFDRSIANKKQKIRKLKARA
jgi:ribosomal RNA-processing protein 17